ETPIVGGRSVLAGSEAHHLTHVMRAKPGTRVVLFDGCGSEFDAEVVQLGRSEIELEILSGREISRELPVQMTLGVALPKGDRQRWLVEKAVELGIARIVPLTTGRSVAPPVRQALKRLQRTVIEASKQCGRNRLLEIAPPQEWPDYVAGSEAVSTRIVAHPHAEHPCAEHPSAKHPSASPPSERPDRLLDGVSRGPVMLAVGPEGGFTEAEISLALEAGWQTVDLGPRILRVETAAILLAAMVTS
ncbi:hypothetical protein LCGC14_2796320, partial [marine sediment metagenome]